MREVGGSLGNGPVLHCRGNYFGNLRIKRGALLNGVAQGLVNRLGQHDPHDRVVEDIAAKDLGHVGNVDFCGRAHREIPFH